MHTREKKPQNTPDMIKRQQSKKRRRRQIRIKCILSISVFSLTLAGTARLQLLKSDSVSWTQFFAQMPSQMSVRSGKQTLSDAGSGSGSQISGSGDDSGTPLSASGTEKPLTGSSAGSGWLLDGSDKLPGGSDSQLSDPDTDDKSLTDFLDADTQTSGSGPASGRLMPDPDTGRLKPDPDAGGQFFSFPSDAETDSLADSETDKDTDRSDHPDTDTQTPYPKDPGSDAQQIYADDPKSFSYKNTDTERIFFAETNSDSQALSGSEGSQAEHLVDTTADDADTDHISYDAEEWNLVLVNPWNKLPDDFTVSLTRLPNGHSIDSRCYPALMEMMDACSIAGYHPLICSSYRTQEKQESLFQERIDELTDQGYSDKEAHTKAATSVARPGTSEHQLGLAVDIVDRSYQPLDTAQEHTPVQQWLIQNSWKYGFILRYPQAKSRLTGIIYEPWHYRYVGTEAAREIHERGICLEEYLEELQQTEQK